MYPKPHIRNKINTNERTNFIQKPLKNKKIHKINKENKVNILTFKCLLLYNGLTKAKEGHQIWTCLGH